MGMGQGMLMVQHGTKSMADNARPTNSFVGKGRRDNFFVLVSCLFAVGSNEVAWQATAQLKLDSGK